MCSIIKKLLLLSEMTSFEFSLGGFSGTSHFVFIDGKRNNKEIRYAKTPGGRYADLKHPNNEINLDTDIKIKEIPLTLEQWLQFVKELTALELQSWKDKYYDNDMYDGSQWNLKIILPGNNIISKRGNDEYPSNWDKFIALLKKYIDKNIC